MPFSSEYHVPALRLDLEYCAKGVSAASSRRSVQIAGAVEDRCAHRDGPVHTIDVVGEAMQHSFRPVPVRSRNQLEHDTAAPGTCAQVAARERGAVEIAVKESQGGLGKVPVRPSATMQHFP